MNPLPKVRRVYLAVEMADDRVEILEISDPQSVKVNVSEPRDDDVDFVDAISAPFSIRQREPVTLTIAVGRQGYTYATGHAMAAAQQELAKTSKAQGQCQSCGSYRLDGKPPFIHRQGCPEDDSPLSVNDWWQEVRRDDMP